eukprot:GHUV01038683.1.p1 GENE.GHUV01038683.1~~GHUV01038683.1.p1  ORF type:complete len:112 (+),score=6.30 GHUV01038683.1:96-431(+)
MQATSHPSAAHLQDAGTQNRIQDDITNEHRLPEPGCQGFDTHTQEKHRTHHTVTSQPSAAHLTDAGTHNRIKDDIVDVHRLPDQPPHGAHSYAREVHDTSHRKIIALCHPP